jgi:hypothetical protein
MPGSLPRSRQIVQVDARSGLRTVSGGATGWNGRTTLTEAQAKSIARTGGQLRPADGLTAPVTIDAQDEILLAEIRRDGQSALLLRPVLAEAEEVGEGG